LPWFDYSLLPGSPRELPLVAALIWNGSQRVRVAGQLDTGADTSLIDASYAEVLGLDRSQALEHVMGVGGGGSITCLRWPGVNLEFEFGGIRFEFKGAFFEYGPDDEPLSIFGADFFAPFIVQFWEQAGLVSIDLSPDFAKGLEEA
jgi:hypothetical protein